MFVVEHGPSLFANGVRRTLLPERHSIFFFTSSRLSIVWSAVFHWGYWGQPDHWCQRQYPECARTALALQCASLYEAAPFRPVSVLTLQDDSARNAGPAGSSSLLDPENQGILWLGHKYYNYILPATLGSHGKMGHYSVNATLNVHVTTWRKWVAEFAQNWLLDLDSESIVVGSSHFIRSLPTKSIKKSYRICETHWINW